MWAWVRIPLLTYFFSYPPKLPSWIKKSKKTVATAGNRTPINCLEGNYANHYTTVAVATASTDIQNASSLKCLRTKWQWWASQTTVRMAEWSKAPDSRMWSFHNHSGWELSGPHMWAWVRIPLLTYLFFFLLFSFFVCILKDNATAGNRTLINCLEGNYANHYTTVAVSSFLSDVLCIFFSKNTLLSHLHTADISFTYSNLPLVGITKLSESDLGEQKEYETHWCLSRGKKEKKKQMGWSYLSKPYLFSTSNRSNKV